MTDLPSVISGTAIFDSVGTVLLDVVVVEAKTVVCGVGTVVDAATVFDTGTGVKTLARTVVVVMVDKPEFWLIGV
jgi:hypothetical protein